jgi:dienelactone hydrolase
MCPYRFYVGLELQSWDPSRRLDADYIPLIVAPEHDHNYTAELKEYSLKVIPTLGVDFDYQYFPTVSHGFAVKGDEEDQIQKKALERAKSAAAAWFVQYLH